MMRDAQTIPAAMTPTSRPARFTSGILGDRLHKNIANLLLRIDTQHFTDAYRQEHDRGFAEPEFAGHYVDAALAAWRSSADPVFSDRAAQVAETMVRHQRADGYLGTYRPGLEFDPTFSVWNQQFSIMALLLYHQHSGDRAALAAAVRCADYIATSYSRADGPSLFAAINQGMENSCILIEFVRLFDLTGEPRFLEFAQWIVARWESGSTRLVSATEMGLPVWTTIGTFKALESILCYRGILRLGCTTGNVRYVNAVRAYWEDLRQWMIGPTGNGAIWEFWNPSAAQPLELTNEFRANENCVAVGWMQLSAELFRLTGDPAYMDEFEKTLYNHLLGSQAIDGHDFSYYQGHLGAKVHATMPNRYSCCRYRGMTMLTQLGEHVITHRDDGLAVVLYGSSTVDTAVDGVPVRVRQATDYPRDPTVGISVDPASPVAFTLGFRVPATAEIETVSLNAEVVAVERSGGFASIRRIWSPGDRVEVAFRLRTVRTEAVINDRPVVLTTYGPLVLAIDTHEGTPLDSTVVDLRSGAALQPAHPSDWSRIVRFTVDGAIGRSAYPVTLVDYASAGSIAPREDRFRIWVTAARG